MKYCMIMLCGVIWSVVYIVTVVMDFLNILDVCLLCCLWQWGQESLYCCWLQFLMWNLTSDGVYTLQRYLINITTHNTKQENTYQQVYTNLHVLTTPNSTPVKKVDLSKHTIYWTYKHRHTTTNKINLYRTHI